MTFVLTALASSRGDQDRSGLAIRDLIRQLRPLCSATITASGAPQTIGPKIFPDRQVLIDALTRQDPGTEGMTELRTNASFPRSSAS